MENQTDVLKVKDKRKFLLVLPLLMIPFVTMAFYALGGGKGTRSLTGMEDVGINSSLPDANAPQKDMQDKLSFYEQAEKDSLKRQQLANQDPYYLSYEDLKEFDEEGGILLTNGIKNSTYGNDNEQKVMSKLAELNKVIEHGGMEERQYPGFRDGRDNIRGADAALKNDMQRLEKMMLSMQSGGGQVDPEMEQITSVLESVLDIQHPERVQDRLKKTSTENLGQVFAVTAGRSPLAVSLMDNKSVKDYADGHRSDPPKKENDFYGLDDPRSQEEENNAIAAVVHETRTVVSGATVKLRLLQEVYINGKLVPKDHFIYATAVLQGERLQLTIESIILENSLFPVKLMVHDLDGVPGIHIPGAISRDVSKQSGDQALQGLGIGAFNPSLGAQAASAGIELSRNLLSRKIKLIKVEIKAGYQVLLKDGKRSGN